MEEPQQEIYDKKPINWRLIIIGVALVFALAIYLVSAGGETELPTSSYKSYDANTKTATLYDEIFILPDTKLLESQLISPEIKSVIEGKNRIVAEFSIEAFDKYETPAELIKEIKFYNLRDGNKEFQRAYTLKQKEIYYVNITDYSSCPFENRTTCQSKPIGSHLVEQVRWNELKLDEPIRERIIIGISTDVYKNDYVEWVPTLLNQEVKEWAVWTAGLNTDLTHYFKFDEGTGVNVPNSMGNKNLTIAGNAPTYSWLNGKIVNATNITSDAGTCVNMNGTGVALDYHAGAIGFWIDTQSDYAVDTAFLLNIPTANGARSYLGMWSGGLSLMLFDDDLGAITPIQKNGWHYVVINWNATSQEWWINGTLQNSFTSSLSGTNNLFSIMGTGVTFSVKGRLDELGIWNRTLTSAEISDLYNDGTGITYTNADTTAPTFSDGTPENMTAYSNQSIAQQINATDETAFGTFVINDTSFFSINQSGYFKNISALRVGTTWINVTINDTSNNKKEALFKIDVSDVIAPTFSNGTPINLTIYSNQSAIQKINATDETAFGTFVINDTTNFQITSTGIFSNKTTLNAGFYWLSVTINDSAGNTRNGLFYVNVSQAISISAVLSAPADNLNYTTSPINFMCNFSSTAQNVSKIKINIYNSSNFLSYTETNSINSTLYNQTWAIPLSDDRFNWSCYAYVGLDSDGLNASTINRTLFLDANAPSFSYSVENGHHFGKPISASSLDVGITYTITDRNFVNATYKVFGTSGNLTSEINANQTGSVGITMTAYGTYSIIFTSTDILNNYKTETQTYSLDLVSGGSAGGGSVSIADTETNFLDASMLTQQALAKKQQALATIGIVILVFMLIGAFFKRRG